MYTNKFKIRVGMSVAHSPDSSPYTPDMQMTNPTMEDKQEAKRRIGGSLAPDRELPSAAA
jgi:phosphatidylserine decarboxylase